MKTLAATFLLLVGIASAQPIDVTMRVDPQRDRRPISPLIYGVNNATAPGARLASRRQGGDRFTTYNWENNASNSGHWTDDPAWIHQNHTSDANVTGYVPSSVPAKAITDFHDASIAAGAYSLVTLQAGHVARDLHGPVSAAEAVPNPARWREVRFEKGAALSTVPDTSDAFVYIDELLAYLVGRYGPASGATGIKGYGIGNEPGAWTAVHPRAHPVKAGYADIFAITRDLARTVKRIDPTAEVYGGVTYGFSEMKDFSDAPDKGMFPGYDWYIDALLAEMKKASDEEGRRLVDVLDVHWYSEAEGNTQYAPVAWSESTPDIVAARVQAPRSLWDRSYVERSWITGDPGRYSHTDELFGERAIALIPRLRASIERYDPGMKIAFGEFGYGGYDHVSGGIAIADALGIFGREGVYYANHWDALSGYVEAAYELYRNYDAMGSAFPGVSVAAATDDDANSAVYAATSADGDSLHVIMINRSLSRAIRASLVLESGEWRSSSAYGFDERFSDVRAMGIASVDNGVLVRDVPPLSAHHLVFVRASTSDAPRSRSHRLDASVAPNPCTDHASLVVELERPTRVTIDLVDALGRHIRTLGDGTLDVGRTAIAIETADLAPGQYALHVTTESERRSIFLAVVR
jgi:mannan endo-1,4-beta-mannosidase